MPQPTEVAMDDLYASLDVETRIVVQQRTSEIKTLMRRTAQDIIDIGQKLIEVKAKLGHGLFGAWLQVEFEWTDRTAQNYMRVATVFKSEPGSDLIPPKALCLLAAPSTPEAAREEALQRADQGERITLDKTRAIIEGHKAMPTSREAECDFSPVATEYTASAALALEQETVLDAPSEPSLRREQAAISPVEPAGLTPWERDSASTEPSLVPAGSAEGAAIQSAGVPISETPGYDSDEWYTPAEYIEAARAVMGDIDLDPATCRAAQETIRAGAFFTKEDDGLVQAWHGRVWLNPPYSASLVQGFVDKLCAEYDAGHMTEAVVLVNNATDTAWFHSLLARFPACVLRRRVPFWRPGFSGGGARQGQVIFYLGPNADRFRGVFSSFGVVVSAWPGVAATGEET